MTRIEVQMVHAERMESNDDKIGILAGWGSFPVEIAERLRSENKKVYVLAIKGHADPRLESIATRVQWTGVLRLGAQQRFFKNNGVRRVAFAGKIFKERILYHGRGWLDHFPDWTCWRLLASIFIFRKRDGRDDTILSTIANDYDRQGMTVLSITDIAPQLLADAGCLTKRRPNKALRADVQFGWTIARQMGALDIGQSMTIKDQVVLGVEAIEGTDALIKRTGALCPQGGFTLVKVAKPQQDMRFDVPTIGLRTVEGVVRAGGRAIAIEANRTILVDAQETLEFANANGICIVSLNSEHVANTEGEKTSSTSEHQVLTNPQRRQVA